MTAHDKFLVAGSVPICVYAPRFTREEFERGLAQEVLGALLGGIGETALSTFIDLVGDDGAKLDRLEVLIKEKREAEK